MPSSFLAKIKQAEASTLTIPLISDTDNSSYNSVQNPVYTEPAPQSSNDYNLIYNKLVYAIQNNNLQRFYPYDRVVKLAQDISVVPLQTLANEFKINKEVAIDLYQLALYDVVILADDSGSMAMHDGRIEELNVVAEKIASVASRFDVDGMTLCFLNDPRVHLVKNSADVSNIIKATRFSGRTPIGYTLRNKIVDPMVVTRCNMGQLNKPVLVIIVTDGEPDSKEEVYNVLRDAKQFNQNVGMNCVEFEFAQIGNDKTAQKFLYDLDTHPFVGDIVDVTSSFELEEEEFAKAGANLTPYMWILKLMLGTIDPAYDAGDEGK